MSRARGESVPTMSALVKTGNGPDADPHTQEHFGERVYPLQPRHRRQYSASAGGNRSATGEEISGTLGTRIREGPETSRCRSWPPPLSGSPALGARHWVRTSTTMIATVSAMPLAPQAIPATAIPRP